MTETDPYLGEMVRLLQSYEPERIILFGSRARGQADICSDCHVIVVKHTDRPFLERLRDLVPYLVEFDRPADILVYTPEEMARLPKIGPDWAVQKEGALLHEPPRARSISSGPSSTFRRAVPTDCPRRPCPAKRTPRPSREKLSVAPSA